MRRLEAEIQESKNIDLNDLLENLRKGDNESLLKMSEFKEQNDKNFRQFMIKKIMEGCKRQE